MEEYYKKICESIDQVKNLPVNPDNVLTMAALMYIKKHGKKPEDYEEMGASDAQSNHAHPFTRETAETWAAGMINADGTHGPHFTMEKAMELMKSHSLTCDPAAFWAALNASYSDLCEFFKKYNINVMDAYVDYTVTFWFKDQDAVDDKPAAYYAHVVKH